MMMVRRISSLVLPLALAICLMGCSTGQLFGPSVKAAPTDPLKALATVTQADLATTIKIAQSVTPPDTMAVTCATFLLGQLVSPATFIAPTGAASALETARIGLRHVLNAGPNDAMLIACGPLALSVAGDVATGAMDVSSTGGFGKFLMALIPFVGILPPL